MRNSWRFSRCVGLSNEWCVCVSVCTSTFVYGDGNGNDNGMVIVISQFHNHAQYVPAVCLVGNMSCKVEIFLKYDRNISIVANFKQYTHSFIQSAMFTGRVDRQTNPLYVLRMTVKLAYSPFPNYASVPSNNNLKSRLVRESTENV